MRTSRRNSKLIKLRARPPYNAAGKTNYPFIRKKTGIYIIRENGKIVYIGYSGIDIYRTMYRHFQSWNHRGQVVITYVDKLSSKKYTVQVTLCSPAKAEKLERTLVIKHQPRDNENKYRQYKLKFTDIEAIDELYKVKTIPDPF